MHELEAARHLRRMENVLILTHVRPDGDTVGCAAALCLALRKLGKTAYLLPNPGVTENTAPYVTPYEAPLDFQPEYIVSVDIATAQLLPENARMYAGQIELAIDHHPSFEHFGQQNIVYLFGKKAVLPYALLVVGFIVLGSLLKLELVWSLADLFNGLMVIPNLLGLLALSGSASRLYRDYARSPLLAKAKKGRQ